MAPAEPTEIPGDADIEQALKEAQEASAGRLASPTPTGAFRPEKNSKASSGRQTTSNILCATPSLFIPAPHSIVEVVN
jgi:hypothetical protein